MRAGVFQGTDDGGSKPDADTAGFGQRLSVGQAGGNTGKEGVAGTGGIRHRNLLCRAGAVFPVPVRPDGTVRTDVSEDDTSYQISAELPGFKKEEINLDVEGDCLTISAQHSEENEESDEKKNYIKRERFYGSYSRSFDITGVDVDAIKAEYADGILKIDLPKVIPVAPASRKLEIQ